MEGVRAQKLRKSDVDVSSIGRIFVACLNSTPVASKRVQRKREGVKKRKTYEDQNFRF